MSISNYISFPYKLCQQKTEIYAFAEFSAFAIMLIEKQKYMHMQKFMLITTDIYAKTNIIFIKKIAEISSYAEFSAFC